MKKALITIATLLPAVAQAHSSHDISGFLGEMAHSMVHALEGPWGLVALVTLGLGSAYAAGRTRSRRARKSENEGQ